MVPQTKKIYRKCKGIVICQLLTFILLISLLTGYYCSLLIFYAIFVCFNFILIFREFYSCFKSHIEVIFSLTVFE